MVLTIFFNHFRLNKIVSQHKHLFIQKQLQNKILNHAYSLSSVEQIYQFYFYCLILIECVKEHVRHLEKLG